MAFEIRCNNWSDAQRALAAVDQLLRLSRFTVREMYVSVLHRTACVVIHDVRLLESKPYCGNHPGPCQVGGGRHYKARYLEGLDWVAWNDMINDALDAIELSAKVINSLGIVIRQDRRRRTDYGMVHEPHVDWEKVAPESDYQDYCGRRAPQSTYPPSTPGIRGWKQRNHRSRARRELERQAG